MNPSLTPLTHAPECPDRRAQGARLPQCRYDRCGDVPSGQPFGETGVVLCPSCANCELGRSARGADERDPDGRVAQFGPQAIEETVQRVLGCRVGGAVGRP